MEAEQEESVRERNWPSERAKRRTGGVLCVPDVEAATKTANDGTVSTVGLDAPMRNDQFITGCRGYECQQLREPTNTRRCGSNSAGEYDGEENEERKRRTKSEGEGEGERK